MDTTIQTSFKKLFNLRVLLVLLILVILIEVGLWIKTLVSPSIKLSTAPTQLNSPLGAKIALVADKTQVKIGDTVSVSVRIFTGGLSADGVDVNIKYDPKVLSLSSGDIIKGTLFAEYPVTVVSGGMLRIGASSSDKGFNGLGELARINLRALAAGKADLTVDFTAGKTTDSNITAEGKDNLIEVENLSLIVGNSSTQTKGNCSVRAYSVCQDVSKTGTYWCSGLKDPDSCELGCFRESRSQVKECNIQ